VSLQLAKALMVAALAMGAPTHGTLRGRSVTTGNLPMRTPRRRDDQGEPGQATNEREQTLPPVLLTTPAYYGTLAAVRALGREGVAVTTAGPSRWAIAAWSKYVLEHVEAPATTDTEHFMSWLLEFGKSQRERHVLLPTCDDTAWLYARFHADLAKHFHVAPSPIEAVHGLLHKGRLAEHATHCGLAVPRTWYPSTEQDVLRIAQEANFPVLVKPVTQVLFTSRSKGRRVDSADKLLEAYASYRDLHYGSALLDYDPSSAHPMVQEYFPGASRGIYNISGYCEGGKLLGARAGRKILQRPRQFGTGVCFEEAPLDQELMAGLERLVSRVGFHGVFETEFVQTEGRSVLIDFNPRFYNQMAFDVARSLPLPSLAYFSALGRPAPTRLKVAAASADITDQVFTYGSAFKVMIASQRLSGAITADEADGWLAWYDRHEGRRVDAVEDLDDPWPALMDRMQMVKRHVRHPRDFVRTIVLNR
jgi:D-aspartate ligase